MTKEQHYQAAAILEEIEGMEGHVLNITEIKNNTGNPLIGRLNFNLKFVTPEIIDLYLESVNKHIAEKQKELEAL